MIDFEVVKLLSVCIQQLPRMHFYWRLFHHMHVVCISLGLPPGPEAPFMMPNGLIFNFNFSFLGVHAGGCERPERAAGSVSEGTGGGPTPPHSRQRADTGQAPSL